MSHKRQLDEPDATSTQIFRGMRVLVSLRSAAQSKLQSDLVSKRGGTIAEAIESATHMVLEATRDPERHPALISLPRVHTLAPAPYRALGAFVLPGPVCRSDSPCTFAHWRCAPCATTPAPHPVPPRRA